MSPDNKRPDGQISFRRLISLIREIIIAIWDALREVKILLFSGIGIALIVGYFCKTHYDLDKAIELLWVPALWALSINLFTTCIIYICWHEGRDRLRGIRIMDGETRNKDFRENLVSLKSKPSDSIKILDISIPTLIWGNCDNVDWKELPIEKKTIGKVFDDAVLKAINNGTDIQILLLHPNSYSTRQRSSDLNKDPDNYLNGMHKTLAHLYALNARINAKAKLDENESNELKFEVRLYNKLPSLAMYTSGDYIYAGFYPHDTSCDKGKVVKILDGTDLGRYVIKQFLSLWKSSISINDFMILRLMIDEKEATSDESGIFYIPRKNITPSLTGELRPSYIAVHTPCDFALPNILQEANKCGSKITLYRTSKEPKILSSKCDAYIHNVVAGAEYNKIANQLEAFYGHGFVSKQSIILKLDQTSQEIEDCGWSCRDGDTIDTPLRTDPVKQATFIASWDDLIEDPYVLENERANGKPKYGIIRKRRIAKYYLHDINSNKLTWFCNKRLFQQGNANYLYIDEPRTFNVCANNFAMNIDFKYFILRNLRYMIVNTPDAKHPNWRITVHQIRVQPCTSKGASPAPEGLHRDGDDYVSMHFINAAEVSGAETRLKKSKNSNEYHEFRMKSFFDSIYINDASIFHEVTPLVPNEGVFINNAYRDVLLIGYSKTEPYELTSISKNDYADF